MNYKGVLKRLLPFAATFAVAVFITSFFVDISWSRYRGMGRHGRDRRNFERMMRENEQLRFENESVKNDNLRLRNELQNREVDLSGFDVPVPPPPMAPTVPVPAFPAHPPKSFK